MKPCPTTSPRPMPHGVLPTRAGSGSLSPLASRRGTSGSSNRNASKSKTLLRGIPYLIVLVGIANYMVYVLHRVAQDNEMVHLADSLHFAMPSTGISGSDTPQRRETRDPWADFYQKANRHVARSSITSVQENQMQASFNRCSFRTYPSHRYYDIDKPLDTQPAFLNDAKYIRGKRPRVLNLLERDGLGGMTTPTKVCIDTTEWEDVKSDRYPFSDGQNPSIVSLSVKQKAEGWAIRLFSSNIMTPLCELYGAPEVEKMFLGVLVVGNAQCRWRMEADDIKSFHFSDLAEAPDRQTIITVLDEDMQTIDQTTLLLENDAPWGTKRNKGASIPAKSGEKGKYERTKEYFDDPRFFFHKGELMVLYRHGPRFGYENQVQSTVHLEKTTDWKGKTTLVAYVKASETFVVCCGRNIALFEVNGDPREDTPSLKALTWVDPVTVVDVDTTPLHEAVETDQKRRRLAAGKEKSNIHGTNGNMIFLHATKEFLGIAHFHRPEDRKESEYALHGHHYTHALFTIAKENKDGEYKLKRLSNEFVFRSNSAELLGSDPPKLDAETIQFASGLDLNGSDVNGKLLISYGINDCEGGAFFVSMVQVQNMLMDVPAGNEVVDLMKPWSDAPPYPLAPTR